MKKKISANFWLIFRKNGDGQAVEISQSQPPISKDLLERIRETQAIIYIYANDTASTQMEGKEPGFQKEIILSAMKERLDKEKMPYDELVMDRPYADVHLDRKIMEHTNWEEILINKLEPR